MPKLAIVALLGFGTWIGVIVPASADHTTSPRIEGATGALPSPGASCVPSSKCCKVCQAGQACGNSCISAKKQCHKGRGCACNASELCAAE